MKCPHCLENFFESWTGDPIGKEPGGRLIWGFTQCAACRRFIVRLTFEGKEPQIVHPRTTGRVPVPPEVEQEFAEDYSEACAVLADSPKASAALSRRCLQSLLREQAGVKHATLNKEIDEVLKSSVLPSHLAEALDAVREIGNFAAHPTKSKHSGEVVDVEPGEAEWSLDTLEGLFDFYFVQPARTQKKKDALNQKLEEAGREALE